MIPYDITWGDPPDPARCKTAPVINEPRVFLVPVDSNVAHLTGQKLELDVLLRNIRSKLAEHPRPYKTKVGDLGTLYVGSEGWNFAAV